MTNLSLDTLKRQHATTLAEFDRAEARDDMDSVAELIGVLDQLEDEIANY